MVSLHYGNNYFLSSSPSKHFEKDVINILRTVGAETFNRICLLSAKVTTVPLRNTKIYAAVWKSNVPLSKKKLRWSRTQAWNLFTIFQAPKNVSTFQRILSSRTCLKTGLYSPAGVNTEINLFLNDTSKWQLALTMQDLKCKIFKWNSNTNHLIQNKVFPNNLVRSFQSSCLMLSHILHNSDSQIVG